MMRCGVPVTEEDLRCGAKDNDAGRCVETDDDDNSRFCSVPPFLLSCIESPPLGAA